MRTMGEWPSTIKPRLMDLGPAWRWLYPLWLRWFKWWHRLPLWRDGRYRVGDVTYWRGVRLVCCRQHFAGDAAVHPWDPGHGWTREKRATLWEPARARDRLLLHLVGDPR